MTADDTNPYLQTETLQLWVKANLRVWSAGMTKRREAEADSTGWRTRTRTRRCSSCCVRRGEDYGQ